MGNNREKPKSDPSDALLPSGKHCKVAADKYLQAVRESLKEVLEEEGFEIRLKDPKLADNDLKKAEQKFSEAVITGYLSKSERILKDAFKDCANELIRKQTQRKTEERRKDWLGRTIIHYLKRHSPHAKYLSKDEVEEEVNISYAVIIGLTIIIHIATNKEDKDEMEKLCSGYTYLSDDKKRYRWGGKKGEEPGILDDEWIERKAREIITRLVKSVLTLDVPAIIKKISLSDTWRNHKQLGPSNFTEEEAEELLDVIKMHKE